MAVRSEYDGLTDVFSPPFLFPSPHSPAAFLVLLWPVCSVKDPAHDVQQVLEAKGNQVLLRKRYDSLVHSKLVSFPEYPLMCVPFFPLPCASSVLLARDLFCLKLTVPYAQPCSREAGQAVVILMEVGISMALSTSEIYRGPSKYVKIASRTSSSWSSRR